MESLEIVKWPGKLLLIPCVFLHCAINYFQASGKKKICFVCCKRQSPKESETFPHIL